MDNAAAVPARETDVTKRLFWAFLASHVAIWTIVPALTQPNAPLDAIEMLYWGHAWQWGYFKHPPLPAWLSEVCWLLIGSADWPLYLASQLCVAGCFWAAWRMARETLAPWPALAGALLLEACFYYNFTTPEMNNNLPAKLFWALSTLFLYWALCRQQLRYWFATGVTLGLGMLSKYDAALLVGAMLVFSAAHPVGRRAWRTPGPYVTLAVAALIFAPHLHWLITNDLPTIQYLRSRSQTSTSLVRHLVYPLEFFGSQAAALVVLLALCATVLGRRWRIAAVDGARRFQRDYLLALVLGPWLLVTLGSLVMGLRLRGMWGAAMWTFAGVLVLVGFQSVGEVADYRRLVRRCALVALVMVLAFAARNFGHARFLGRPSRVHFPGREVAGAVLQRWQGTSSGALPLVAGDWWIAGNVAFYSEDRPHVYADLRPDWSPWASNEQLRRRGGVIVWPMDKTGLKRSQKWLASIPEAQVQAPIELTWDTGARVFPLRIGIAVVPGTDERAQRTARINDSVQQRR